MRRLAALLALLLAGALVVTATGGAQDSPEDGPTAGDYRVDAIFDTAKGIVPGQLVKVAGARVGEVADVVLTPDYQARIQLSLDSRFAPFREDARCEIQPEGLISENFVQCDPGTPAAPELKARGDDVPTVPIERTAVPINLTDLFEVWKVPVRDRLRIILTSLGAGVAARGEDLNEVLRRANPTLGLLREAIQIVHEQRNDLTSAVVDARAVTRELARDPQRLQAFVDEAADVATTTGRRRAELQEGIRRMPELLAAARPALRRLDQLSEAGTPLARQLRGAAPDVDALLGEVPAAVRPAVPALRALGATAQRGRRTVRSATPVARLLRSFSRSARPAGDELEKLLVNQRDRGFVEGLLSFVYTTVRATARYDTVGHMLPAHTMLSQCGFYAEETEPGCDANYHRTSGAHRERSRERKREPKRGASRPEARPEQPKVPLLQDRPHPQVPRLPDVLPKVTGPVGEAVGEVLNGLGIGPRDQRLLDFLLAP